MPQTFFPSLAGLENTIETLHAYSRVVGMVPRAHADPHPKWWHLSLTVVPNGLITHNIRLPSGDVCHLRLDFWRDKILLVTTRGEQRGWNLAAGDSADQLAEILFRALAEYGLEGKYNREKYASDRPGIINPAQTSIFWQAILAVEETLRRRWNRLSGALSPIQMWPHGFDMSFEWFGLRRVEYEEGGKAKSYPAQINLGWSPGEPSHPSPYFYSNPWPFEAEKLVDQPLPHGARWIEGPWQGSLLEYESLVDDPDAVQKVLEYAERVFDLAAPLMESPT